MKNYNIIESRFEINEESIQELLKDKTCRHYIHIINSSRQNKIICKYTSRLYSYIKKIYNVRVVGICFDVLELKKLKNSSSRCIIVTKKRKGQGDYE